MIAQSNAANNNALKALAAVIRNLAMPALYRTAWHGATPGGSSHRETVERNATPGDPLA
jgi:hypothetical protein